VLADADKMAQVLDNLVSNAVKYSPPGSKVRVEGLVLDDAIEVRVRDWGPGISKDEAEHLFEPFFRGKARPTAGEPSTGLGLKIVKGIVSEHRGEVGVVSEVGNGAVFWFKIPHPGGDVDAAAQRCIVKTS
jgi:signal transduction histidine kinase